MPSKQLTWFITGTSSGFGEIFVHSILARGDRVIATARSLSKIAALKAAGAAVLEFDVTAPQSVLDAKAKEAIAIYGTVDVVVNNAGYVVSGTLEDTTAEDWQNQYATNVFGSINTTRAFLPHMRERRSGVVIWFGSLGGWKADPVVGIYSTTKFAIAGVAESFAGEVKPFGVKSLCVDPGYFRTSLLSEGNKNLIPTKFKEYEPIVNQTYDLLNAANGKQPGDPVKGVERILDVVRGEGLAKGREIPWRLVLGSDCVKVARQKLKELSELVDEWEEISVSTDIVE